MMLRLVGILALIILILSGSATAQEATPEATPAQETCAVQVQAALERAARECAAAGIDEVCFGSGRVELQPRERDFAVSRFNAPGDRVATGEVFALTLLPFQPQEAAYGVVVLRPRANLPEGALTLIATGDVRLQNVSEAEADFIAREVTVRRGAGANVRALPTPDGEVLGAYYWGQTLTAIGRTEDGAWLWVLADGRAGWVLAQLVAGDFDFALLEVAALDDTPTLYAPFQAFDITTGLLDSPCTGDINYPGPASGVLMQTPNIARSVTVLINNLPVRFVGTLYLQGGNEELLIQTLEGTAEIGGTQFSAERTIITLSEGEMVRVPLDADGLYAEYPRQAEPYLFVQARRAPLALLPRPVELPFSPAGLFRTFTPNTGFLQSLPADGVCVVAWSVGVNIRQGPGTEYALWAALPGGYAGQPDARAVGSDGLLWWRFAPGVWLNSNPTGAAGQCGMLPLLERPVD